ncbi:MAG: HDIG domain-containing protein [Armatimonadetes bacterium]|nr:HDIG domain-containing protein [Armatimonadota bacterium]
MYLRRDWSPSPEDLALLERYLTPEERELFERMDPPDQQHSFKVANLCARSLDNFPDANRDAIMKAALLHDVGKIGANLDLGFRTCWVLSHKLAPWLMDWLSLHSEHARPGTFRHKMWLQRTHAHSGAQVLREMGVAETVCRLVEATATRREPGDPLDWRIIKAADGDVVLAPGDETR